MESSTRLALGCRRRVVLHRQPGGTIRFVDRSFAAVLYDSAAADPQGASPGTTNTFLNRDWAFTGGDAESKSPIPRQVATNMERFCAQPPARRREGPGFRCRRTPEAVLAINFVADVGKQMLESSTSVSEVVTRLREFLPAVGIDSCSLDANMSSITLSYWRPGMPTPLTTMRDLWVAEPRLEQLKAAESLLDRFEQGGIRLDEAYEQLRALQRSPRLSRRYARLAILFSVSGWVLFLNGLTLATVLVALLATALTFPIDAVTRRLRLPLVFGTVIAAIVVAAVPNLLATSGVALLVGPAVVGSLFVYLPGRALVSSVIDGLTNAPLSSLSRGYQALITAGGLAVGMLIGSQVGIGIGLEYQPSPDATPLVLSVLGATIGVLGIAVAWGLPHKHLLPTLLIAAAGWLLVALKVGGLQTADWFPYAISSVLVGVLGAIIAAAQRTAASVYVGVAILPLVPGFTLYNGMLALAQGETANAIDYLGHSDCHFTRDRRWRRDRPCVRPQRRRRLSMGQGA